MSNMYCKIKNNLLSLKKVKNIYIIFLYIVFIIILFNFIQSILFKKFIESHSIFETKTNVILLPRLQIDEFKKDSIQASAEKGIVKNGKYTLYNINIVNENFNSFSKVGKVDNEGNIVLNDRPYILYNKTEKKNHE